MISEKENPAEAQLGGEASTGSDEIGKLPARIARYSTAKDRATSMLQYCRKIGAEAEAKALEQCGNFLLFHNYYTVGKVRLAKMESCKKHLLCPLCAIRRGAKTLRVYLDRFEHLKRTEAKFEASMVTFTVKNGPDLTERLEHLQKAIQRLQNRRRMAKKKKIHNGSEWTKALGVIGSYEIKVGERSKLWHPHVHAIVLHRDNIDQKALRDEWFQITGDSHQVDVQKLRHPEDPAQDFVEVFKYALKASDMSLEDNFHAYQVLSKKRLLFSCGLFWGVKVPKELTDDLLHGEPYQELFFRYFPGSGYNYIPGEVYHGRKVPYSWDIVLNRNRKPPQPGSSRSRNRKPPHSKSSRSRQ